MKQRLLVAAVGVPALLVILLALLTGAQERTARWLINQKQPSHYFEKGCIK